MKLFHVSQDVNNNYDTYSDFVIACEDEETAKWTHPNQYEKWDGKQEAYSSWCGINDVKVEYIGEAKEGTTAGIICSSFHAG